MAVPLTRDLKVFFSRHGAHLFVADRSRVYDISQKDAGLVNQSIETGETPTFLDALTGRRQLYVKAAPPDLPPVKSFSLNLAQLCNMRCGYCYADFGQFGGQARRMPEDLAYRAVDLLLGQAEPYQTVVLGFMGGEPLLNRDLLRKVTAYAQERARGEGKQVRFSLTTNGTLVEPDDARFFARYSFHVSVSLDGDAKENDRFRVLNSSTGSYAAAVRGLQVFRDCGWPRHLAARATVTARGGRLLPIVDHLISLGFDSVGVAPVLASPDPRLAFSGGQFETLLARMIECGEKALDEIRRGRRYPFSNLETALSQIHLGAHRPFPCGAAAGYLSVSAEGALFACHRLVDNPEFAMGNLRDGPDADARSRHLAHSHVDSISPCRECWARYLCGGGCYHEVSHVGRPACEYIRGWLEFCLTAYAEVSSERPEYFAQPRPKSPSLPISSIDSYRILS